MLFEQLTRDFVPAHDQLANLVVDAARGRFAEAGALVVAAEAVRRPAEGDGPSDDIPNSQTMRRAISVARSMSLPAPLVMCRMKISSATRPPMRIAIFASR